ncbi:MAG: 4Fe-4S binding protein [Lachnospiraceae bacterium]|nr:4Fe-4S binding protein [Lachnospiraceae bacterium]
MSIQINKMNCVGCGRCIEVCPGNLIKLDADKKAVIPYPRDCWGCTSCLKECKHEAINFFLGADIGGMGSILHTRQEGSRLVWEVDKWDGSKICVEVDKNRSNQY